MAISKVSVAGFILALMFLPALVMAQDSGLIPCGYGDNPCDTGDVANFVNGLISFLIQMLGIIAVIVMVYAGFRLVTSGGNEGEATKAKELFTNVVIGIVIILAAWLVVDTIMKTLTGDGLDVWGRLTGGEYGTATALVDNGATGAAGCTNCVQIKGISCKNSKSCSVDPAYAERLEKLSSAGIQITEAWPPTRTHQASCHTNGTCTDVVFADRNFNSERVKQFQELAASNGMRAVYEPPSGVSCAGYTNCITYDKTKSTGHHFSLYMQ